MMTSPYNEAHTIDMRGVYLGTELVDPMGPQPLNAVYEALPEAKSGLVRVWRIGVWHQVAEQDLPPIAAAQAQSVPETVLRWQAVRALRLHADPNAPERSCLAAVQALRDAAPERQRADIDDALQAVLTWRRQSPTLQQIAQAAGWSPEFVDELFAAAGEYEL